jgi:hypothetical protein
MFISPSTVTGDTMYAQDSASQRQLWSDIADMFEDAEDPHNSMEGGPQALIETITDTAKGRGHKITFPIGGRTYNRAKLGEAEFTATTDFSRTPLGHDDLVVDYVRFAHSESIRAAAHMGMVGSEIFNRVPEQLGEMMGWHKSVHTQKTILHKINDENRVIAGNKTKQDDLEDSDTLSWDEVVDLSAWLEPMGAKPAYLGTDEQGNSIFGNAVIATSVALQSLKKDPTYKTNLQQAGPKAMSNKLFAGGVTMVDGNAFMKFAAKDHDDAGPIACAYSPKAMLGTAIASGAGPLDIFGGGSADFAAMTTIDFMLHFPKFAYSFLPTDTLSTTTKIPWDLNTRNNFYVTIVNPRNAATDPGKFNIYEISANNGNKLTVARRMAAAGDVTGSNIAYTSVGDLTWNSALNTDVHPIGSLVYLSTSRGKPLIATPMLTQRALRRGYGMERNKRTTDEKEGGFGLYTYIRTVFGQSVRKRKDGRVPGVGVLIHTGSYEGWNIPSYVA